MISNFGFHLVYVSEPTFALRIRATVEKELNGTAYTVFLAPKVLSLLTCYSQFLHETDVGVSRLAFNARTARTTEPMANAQTFLREQDVSAKTFWQKKFRDVSANFSCRNVSYHLGFVFGVLQTG